jgi:hypothetical protein
MKAGSAWICFVLAALVVTAALYTYPLVFNISTQFPGLEQSDTYLSVWNIWHFKKSVLDGFGFFALTTKFIFYPQQPSLAIHNYMITSGLMSLPFQALWRPIVSMNLLFFIQFVLTGLGMYVLVWYYTKNRIAALWSGITLSFCPYVIIQSCYFLHFSAIWFFPWFIYALWRFLDSGRLRFGALAASVYALSLFEDQTYFFFLTILAVLLIFFQLYTKRPRPARAFIRNAGVSILLFLCLTFWYLFDLLAAALVARSSLPVWPDAAIDYFSLHPSGLLRPSPLLTLYRAVPYLCTPIMHITSVFIGYIPLFFACFAFLRLKKLAIAQRRMVIFWSATGALFLLLAAGPMLFGSNHFLNRFAPYNLVCSGIFRQLRIPVRFSLVALIALYIIAGFGVAQALKRKKNKRLGTISLGLFLIVLQIIEFLPLPYPLLDLPVPKVYADLAARDKGTPVLVLPLGWQSSYRTVGHFDKEIQFYQTVHQHPVFQGQIARIENSYFDYYTSQAGFRYLADADKRAPTTVERAGVLRILRKYGIKNVVIHLSYFDRERLIELQEIFKMYPDRLSVDYVGR